MSEPAVFSGASVRVAEINGHVRFIALPTHRILLALQPWRLLDARAHGQSLSLPGVYTDLEGDLMLRTLGPFAATDIEPLAASLRARYALPRVLERVSCEALEASPRDYHGRHVEVEGEWESGFECSSFAGAWLDVPSSVSIERGSPPLRSPHAPKLRSTDSIRKASWGSIARPWTGRTRNRFSNRKASRLMASRR